MKKIILIILLVSFGLSIKSFAQPGNRIKSLKIAIYTEELNLTSMEAQKFWPIFNEYESKLADLRNEMKNSKMQYKGKEGLSEKEAEAALDSYLNFKQNQLDLEKEYMLRLKAVIPVKKIISIPKAENRFKKALLTEIKKKGRP
ncbi:MAG: hypothetical protein ISR55_09005 [Bacteroidetes bacterium]|nr:hypothetical protein [Bacteroidota bacterium]